MNPDTEDKREIKIVPHQFLSEEWVTQEKLPRFTYNLGKGNHIELIHYEGKYYVTRKTTKIVAGPIDVLESGRS